MKTFLKALINTGFVVLGLLIIYLGSSIWFDFIDHLNCKPETRTLLMFAPCIVLFVISCFCGFCYHELQKKTCLRDIKNEDEAYELEDPKIFLDQIDQASHISSKSKMKFVCPRGLEAAAIAYFKDSNVEVVFPEPIEAKEFHEHMKELLEKEKKDE